MVQGPDVAARLKLNNMSRPDLDRQKVSALGQTWLGEIVLITDCVYHPRSSVQAEDLFPGITDDKLTVPLDHIGTCLEE